MTQKIKDFIESKKGRDIMTAIIIILLGLIAFGLGRLSKNEQKSGVEIKYPQISNIEALSSPASALEAQNTANKAQTPQEAILEPKNQFFASSRGNKYYHLGCTGGKTLKKENIIYFNTEQEAVGAGYEKSNSCK